MYAILMCLFTSLPVYIYTVAEIALQDAAISTVEGGEGGSVQVCAVLVDSGGLPLQREVVVSLSTQDGTAGNDKS